MTEYQIPTIIYVIIICQIVGVVLTSLLVTRAFEKSNYNFKSGFHKLKNHKFLFYFLLILSSFYIIRPFILILERLNLPNSIFEFIAFVFYIGSFYLSLLIPILTITILIWKKYNPFPDFNKTNLVASIISVGASVYIFYSIIFSRIMTAIHPIKIYYRIGPEFSTNPELYSLTPISISYLSAVLIPLILLALIKLVGKLKKK